MIKSGELFKIIKNKGVWMVVLSMLFLQCVLTEFSKPAEPEYTDSVYRLYCENDEGNYSPEMLEEVLDKKERYEKALGTYGEKTEMYLTGEINKEEYTGYLKEYQKAQAEIKTVNYLIKKYSAIRDSGTTKVFYDTNVQNLFAKIALEPLLMLVVIYFAIYLFGEEHVYKTDVILKTSANGMKRATRSKIRLAFGMGFVSALLVYLIILAVYAVRHGTEELGYGISGILGFGKYGSCSVLSVYLLETAERSLFYGCIALASGIIYLLVKNRAAGIILAALIIAVPEMNVKGLNYGALRYVFLGARLGGAYIDLKDYVVCVLVCMVKTALYAFLCVYLRGRKK